MTIARDHDGAPHHTFIALPCACPVLLVLPCPHLAPAAPELVLGQGHYKGVDIWAIGVLLYEMVSGHSPFYDPVGGDQMVICKNIVKGKFAWPGHVKDKEIKDIVAKILVRNVTSRLGCRKDGISEVMDHKFFDPLDWR